MKLLNKSHVYKVIQSRFGMKNNFLNPNQGDESEMGINYKIVILTISTTVQ